MPQRDKYLFTASLFSPAAPIWLKSSPRLFSLIPPFPHTDAEHDASEVVNEVLAQPPSFSTARAKQEPTVRALANLSRAKSQDELSIEFQQKQRKDAQGILKLQLDSNERLILLGNSLGCI